MMRLESFMLAWLELNIICFYINLSSVTENIKEWNITIFGTKYTWFYQKEPKASSICRSESHWLLYEKRRTPYTKEELRLKIVQSWEEIDFETIRKGVAAFRKRLLKVVKQKGGPIEMMLWIKWIRIFLKICVFGYFETFFFILDILKCI